MQALYGLRNIAQSLQIDPRDVLSRMAGVTGQRLISAMAPRRPNWYRFDNAGDGENATLYLYDEIGWFGTTASGFAEELAALDVANLDVRINSVGGDVFDGIAIFNALRTHEAQITTQVDSAALSIASVIAQAGDRRIMVSGSQMMIHPAWGLSIGNAEDMRTFAELLDRQTDNIAGIYAERIGGSGKKARMLSLMRDETWFTPSEAVAEGLADEVLKPASKSGGEDPGSGTEGETSADRWAEFIVAASVID